MGNENMQRPDRDFNYKDNRTETALFKRLGYVPEIRNI